LRGEMPFRITDALADAIALALGAVSAVVAI
jgi:hypothetical protein